MPNTRCLRPLSSDRYQVIINNLVAAVLLATADGADIFILADEVRKLTSAQGELLDIARRLAEGEFDNDFRFEITRNPEPDDPASMYFVAIYATPSQQVTERYTTDRPYDDVAAAREAQAIPFEERMALYAERGW